MRTIILPRTHAIELTPLAPFNFDATFHKPAHFPSALEMWEPGKHWQAIRVGENLFGLRIESRGTISKPKVKVVIYYKKRITAEGIEFIKREIVWRFELDRDLREFNKLAREDTRFFSVFRRWVGMRNSSQHSLYELLIIAIVLQNATVRRTVQMMDTLLMTYGTKVIFDNKEIFAIWLPGELKRISEHALRKRRIGYRAKSIKRLSEDFTQKKIDESALRKLDKETTKRELMKLYGVGPETARILLFEAFHHWDAFDHIAPWQQKIYSRLFYRKPLVPANKIQDDIKKRYGKYAALAAHYIWEDVFWKRKHEKIPWLEKEIRL